MAATDTQTPLLLPSSAKDKKSHVVRAVSVENVSLNTNGSSSIKPTTKKSKHSTLKHGKSAMKIPETLNSGKHLYAQTSNTLSNAGMGNLKFLQNRWTDLKHDSQFIQWIETNKQLVQSKRKELKVGAKFTGVNPVWDAVRYGYCKAPNVNYNPYVRTSLIRAGLSDNDNDKKKDLSRTDTDASEDDDDDDDIKSPKDSPEQKEELETVRTTLPIYNGGNDVRMRKCDRNSHTFPLKEKEWATSWLSFDVTSDKILTSADEFIGAVSIGLRDIKQPGQVYYTQLPLINKKNYSRQMQMKAEKKFETKKLAKNNIGGKSNLNLLKQKLGYSNVTSDDKDDSSSSNESECSDSDEKMGKEIVDKMVKKHEHLNITGVLHVKAMKKFTTKSDVEDVFGENKNVSYDLEIEIMAITNLSTLKLKQGMDHRSFYGGILAFICYLLFYAIIMFVAEIDTQTGMNEYKESIWFALVTVTTIGYGDIYAQTKYSKVLNGLFITINVIIIAGFVANLLGYVVDAGQEALDSRMDHMMNGAQNVFKHQEEIQHKKLKKHISQKQLLFSDKNKNNKKKEHNRRQSAPAKLISNQLQMEEKKEKELEMKETVKEIEVRTAKATKLKLNQLTNLDGAEKKKFKTQIYVNVILFILVIIFGFFALGVAILLTGESFLTNFPYFGYQCVGDDDEYCKLDYSAKTVFIDSLYYTIVSMTSIGYGDIYPKSSPIARVLGSLFILFGTLMLVRLLDLVSSYMIWKQNFTKKKRNLGQLLTSQKEFFQFDLDDNGSISKYEFLVGMLIKLDIVDMPRIDAIMSIFHETDLDGNGVITRNELKQKVDQDNVKMIMKLKWGDAWKEIHNEREKINNQLKNIKINQKKLEKDRKKLNKEREIFENQKNKWQFEKKEMFELKNNDNNNDIQIVVEDDDKQ